MVSVDEKYSSIASPAQEAAKDVEPVLHHSENRSYVQIHSHLALDGHLTVIRHRANLQRDVVFLNGGARDVLEVSCALDSDASHGVIEVRGMPGCGACPMGIASCLFQRGLARPLLAAPTKKKQSASLLHLSPSPHENIFPLSALAMIGQRRWSWTQRPGARDPSLPGMSLSSPPAKRSSGPSRPARAATPHLRRPRLSPFSAGLSCPRPGSPSLFSGGTSL